MPKLKFLFFNLLVLYMIAMDCLYFTSDSLVSFLSFFSFIFVEIGHVENLMAPDKGFFFFNPKIVDIFLSSPRKHML